MTEILKPCPFCGGEVEISTYRNEGYQIECPNHEWPKREMRWGKRPESGIAADIGMFTWGISDEAKAALIEAWNTRTPEQAIAATLGESHPYEQRITGDGSDWGEIMADAFDNLMSSASESCAPDELRALESHIAAMLGRPKAKSHPYGYEPDTGAFDTTRCECGCINDISATYCNDCGGEIEIDVNAEKEIYHTPAHMVFVEKHDDGSLEFAGKRYIAATLGRGECEIETTESWLPAERYHRCKHCGAFFAVLDASGDIPPCVCPNCGKAVKR